MAKLQFGVRQGLAVDMQWDQRLNDLRYQQEQEKAAKIQAKADAKQYGEDMAYKQPMNNFDNPRVKGYAQQQIQMIGKFVNQNQDWETNYQKRGIYNQMINDLKNGDDYRRGVQSDTNWEQAQKDMQDIRYANVDFADVKGQWDNYNKFGNQLGEEAAKKEGVKQFIYATPKPPEDTTKLLMEVANNTQYDMNDAYGYDGVSQSVSEARKQDAVKNALASSWAPQLQKDYLSYIGHLQGQGIDKTKAKSIDAFTRERMDPYFKANAIQLGHVPPKLTVPKKGNGTTSGVQESKNLWLNMHEKALSVPGTTVEFGVSDLQSVFGSDGEMNLDGIKTPFGDPMNLGTRKATSTGKIKVTVSPNGSKLGEHQVETMIPIDEFLSWGGKYDEVIDEAWTNQLHPFSVEDSNWDIHDEYKDRFTAYTDPKTSKRYVKFKVVQPYDPDNPHLADKYGNVHNIKQYGEETYEGNYQEPDVTQAEYNLLQPGDSYYFNGELKVKQ